MTETQWESGTEWGDGIQWENTTPTNAKLAMIFQNQPFQAAVPVSSDGLGVADKFFLLWQYGVDAILNQHVFMYYFRKRRS